MKLLNTYSLAHYIDNTPNVQLCFIYKDHIEIHDNFWGEELHDSLSVNIISTPSRNWETFKKQARLKEIKYEEINIKGELRRTYGYYSRNGFNCNQFRY